MASSPNTKPTLSAESETAAIKQPPHTWLGIVSQLGPGLIIAASIVGSGELIATTRTGAQAGFTLLWLIVLGCVIKVFAQIEIGRYALTSGLPTLSALDQVPGPRFGKRGNWLVWYWFFMWFASIGQLGGIVGGVGQSMALSLPVTEQGRLYNQIQDMRTKLTIQDVITEHLRSEKTPADTAENQAAEATIADELKDPETSAEKVAELEAEYRARFPVAAGSDPTKLSEPLDDRLWAIPFALVTSLLLIWGKFNVVLAIATVLVAGFTFITAGNVVALQYEPAFQIQWSNIIEGFSFRLPPDSPGGSGLAIGLATIGIIGVGAAELVQYPYWCLEKGYARWTGRDDGSEAWIQRAKGWMKVMLADAWASMIIYTVATVAFYLLGAAILHRCGLVPSGNSLIRTLAVMYQPVFSSAAPVLFLIGAFSVLYSTFYVANASHARTFADGLCVIGAIRNEEKTRTRAVQFLCGLFPILCLAVYWYMPEPGQLVAFSGMVQAIMLPMLCGAAIYFRYYRCHPEMRPSRWWDWGLWASAIVMLIIAVWTFWTNLTALVKAITG